MKKFFYLFLFLLLLTALSILIYNNKEERNIWKTHIPLGPGEDVILKDVSTFTLKDVIFSTDGSRYAIAYHATEESQKERVRGIFPIAEATSINFLSTNYLVLDGEIIEVREGTANSSMWDFGFLADGSFWRMSGEYREGKIYTELQIEGVTLPPHDTVETHLMGDKTFFILDSNNISKRTNPDRQKYYYLENERSSETEFERIANMTITEEKNETNLPYTVEKTDDGEFINAEESQKTFYNSIEEIVTNKTHYVALATPRNEKSYGDNNGIVVIINGKEHKLYHYVFPDSLIVTDSDTVKFAAILNYDLVFVELQL